MVKIGVSKGKKEKERRNNKHWFLKQTEGGKGVRYIWKIYTVILLNSINTT